MIKTIFSATDIIKKYKKSNFTLDVAKIELKPDTITGVVGENGNGKTTLLNIIAGNIKAESSSFTYFEKTPTTANNWIDIREKIAFIPQRIPRWYGTLRQNLLLKATLENIPKEEIENELEEVLNFLNLKKYAHLKWSEISTGYRLRFELARILIGKPQLLVLDEPIANLDINAQQQFLSDLKSLTISKDYPITIILSSQQLHEIETVADEMIFMKHGKSIFSGNKESLTSDKNTIELLVENTTELEQFLKTKNIEFLKRGVYYHIELDNTITSNAFLKDLISNTIEISYYRNISNSTKKLF